MSDNRIFNSAMRIVVGIALIFVLSLPQYSAHADTYTVTNTNDSGAGSLRAAIALANGHIGADTIEFDIPESDPGYGLRNANVWTIVLTTGALSITDVDTYIDGSSQGDINPNGPEIEVNQSSVVTDVFALQAGSTEINRLCITGGYVGVHTFSGSNQNIIVNNYIGLDCLQANPVPNYIGVRFGITSNSNQLIANFVSGNTSNGVEIDGSDYNTLSGNFIGTNQKSLDVGNGGNGILISGSSNENDIGDSLANRNIISMNDQNGIQLETAGTNYITNNYIGTDFNGVLGLANLQDGIHLANGADSNQISENLISANGQSGISITDELSDSNDISNNKLGVDASGTLDLGNAAHGVVITGGADNTYIQNNLISGNNQHGIYLTGGGVADTVILSNLIGSDFSANSPIGNGWHGVAVYNGPLRTNISHNAIVANGWSGLVLLDSMSNISSNNHIGVTQSSSSVTLGNAFFGIHILGGFNTVFNDTIAHNGLANPASGDGIRVDGATYAASYNIMRNLSIFGNGGSGIENINDGNNNMAGPILDMDASCKHISGSVPVAEGYIDIYSGPDDEGRTFMVTLVPDTSGYFEFDGDFPGPYITATWTDGYPKTSEFSARFACVRTYVPMIMKP